MKNKIIIAFEPPSDVRRLAEHNFQVITEGLKPLSAARLVELAKLHQPEALLVAMSQKFSAEDVGELPSSIKIVATCSVGYDNLPLAALKTRSIWATNTPDVLTDATADLTMMLLLGACRRIRETTGVVARGWGQMLGQAEMLGVDPRGKKLGILGMGRIGQAVAHRARAFGMDIFYCNRHRLTSELELGAQYFPNLREMLPHCQFLSLHAPGTADTEKIMNAEAFATMPKGSVFINVARGSLVDEEALFAALQSEHLFAAGLDVCRSEPHRDPRFLQFPNVLLTPHIGSATRETRNAMGFRALENIDLALRGEKPRDALKA